jgi:hypothetical protein
LLPSIYSVSSLLLIRDDHVAMAAALTSVSTQPTSNIVTTKASYEILFTTATTGTIKTVTIAFPTGFDVGSVSLIEKSGIGAGVLSVSGTTLTYKVASPVRIAAGIAIRFGLSNIVHPGTPGAYSISITTKDSLGNTIDGPTVSTSSVVQIGIAAIANGAVTSAKLAANSVTTNNMVSGSVTGSKIASNALLINKTYGNPVSFGCQPAGGTCEGISYCPSGYIDVGGSYGLSDPSLVVMASREPSGVNGWEIIAENTDTSLTHGGTLVAVCIDIVPNP